MSSNIRKAIETIKEEVLVTKKLTEEYIFGIVIFLMKVNLVNQIIKIHSLIFLCIFYGLRFYSSRK